MADNKLIIPVERIEQAILLIRGQKVMLDADLAKLYGVETKQLNRAVHRNINRFPEDFMFQLTAEEAEFLRCQIGTSKVGRGGRRYLPYVFTEHGAIMAASVLNTQRAIEASIYVVRAFVKLRELLATHKELARKVEKLEQHMEGHDEQSRNVFEAIRQLMAPPATPRRQIEFKAKEARAAYRGNRKGQKN